MVGILIATHGELGLQFLTTARIMGIASEEYLSAVGVDPADSPDEIRGKMGKAIRSMENGDGVLILTDLFGGTPTNVSLSFLEEGKVEVVTGLNLPMVIKAINSRNGHNLNDLAKLASEAGKENIFLAGEVFRLRRAKKPGDVKGK